MTDIWRMRAQKLAHSAFALALVAVAAPVFARVPNDPDFSRQWYLSAVSAPAAWDESVGSKDVIIAVIDTGFFVEHPDLAPNFWRNAQEKIDDVDNDRNGFVDDLYGWDFVRGVGAPILHPNEPHSSGGFSHGTVIAGMIGSRGNNAEGTAGVLWRATIMPLTALDGFGDGDAATVTKAVDYAVMMGADVISLSLVGERESEELTSALRRAYEAGVVIVAASGNQYKNGVHGVDLGMRPSYPVCTDAGADENWIIGVTATSRTDARAWFANYGDGCVDISAPGDDIWSTEFKGEPAELYGGGWLGTSLAAPLVAGAAGLLKSIDPTLTPAQITNILLNSADPIDALNHGFAGKLGSGRLNIARAVEMIPYAVRRARRGMIVAEAGGRAIAAFDDRGLQVPPSVASSAATTQTADLDHDGTPEMIVAISRGRERVIQVKSPAGFVYDEFLLGKEYRSARISFAVGDLNGDGADEVLISPPSRSRAIKIFSWRGPRERSLELPEIRAGSVIFTGDLDGDGIAEIFAHPGTGRAGIVASDANGKFLFETAPVAVPRGARLTIGVRRNSL